MISSDHGGPYAKGERREHWLVFSDDWGRHPSSCQYLIEQLLDRIDVTWVNTIGMRPPRFDRVTLERVWGKIRGNLNSIPRTPKQSKHSPQPRVITPWMWPWYGRRWDRALNRWLLRTQLNKLLSRGTRADIALTTIPIVADLIDQLPVNRWVYYCVDDFSLWPGLDQKTMGRLEQEVVLRVDRIVAASARLQGRLNSLGRQSALCTHGVDIQKWQSTTVTPYSWPSNIRRPLALFWGVIDRRLDTALIVDLCQRLPDLSLVLVGPRQQSDPVLEQLSNVHLVPAVKTDELAAMAQSADCLVMPYAITPLTLAMQPLKLKEYLATGRPTVVRQLPSTEPWSNACDVAETHQAFVESIRRCLKEGVSREQIVARRSLQSESWHQKAAFFYELVHDAN